MGYVVGCNIIHEELLSKAPKGWKILRAIEICLPYSEDDPEGCISKFAVAFEDEKRNLRLCEFTHSYHGCTLDTNTNAYYDDGVR